MSTQKTILPKEELKRQLNAIAKQEHKAMVDENYPIIKAQFEGKYFKYRNSYGGDAKPWWLYAKVTSIKPDDIYDTGGNGVTATCECWRFQLCSDGRITIDPKERTYIHSLGEEITEAEFNAAWNKMIDKINELS